MFNDVRTALRAIARRPGLSLTIALTLGLGIGLTTTMFSVVNGAIWRGLPVPDPGQVMHLERTFATGTATDPAAPLHDFLDWRRQQTSFSDLAAFSMSAVNVGGTLGPPERYAAAIVTPNIFEVLGVAPILGRSFREEDARPGAPPVAIIGETVWRDHVGGARLDDLLLQVDGESVTVVGVMPGRFDFPFNQRMWLPLRDDPARIARGEGPRLEVIGRLRDGVSRAAAQAEVTGIAGRLAREYPATNAGVGAVVRPYVIKFLGDPLVTLFYTFLAGAVAVLLIACVNVANLLLVSSSLRARELAVRSALGASRTSLVRHLLVEVILLTAVGGAVGVGLAQIGVRLFNASLVNPPFWLDVRIDGAALVFVLALIGVVSLAAGLYPAVRASGVRSVEILKDETRGGSGRRVGRLNRALVVVEMALAATLLVGAGLLVRSLVHVRAIDFGFAVDRVLVGGILLPAAVYPDESRQRAFWDQLLERLSEQPGVRSATLCSMPPGMGSGRILAGVEGTPVASPKDYPQVRGVTIAARFFETFDVVLLEGREFGSIDVPAGRPTAIVNRAFADRFLTGGPTLGRRLRIPRDGGEVVATIIGVAPNLRMGVGNRDPEIVYLPLAQWRAPALSVAVRTQPAPLELAPTVRDVVATLDPSLPISDLRTMRDALRSITWYYGSFGTVFVVFGAVGLTLALVGVYSLMAFSVTQRTREIGVRLAMGASPSDVLRLLLRQTLTLIGAGLAAGLLLAAFGARLLGVFLVGVEPRDPAVYGLIILVMVLTGLLAIAGPARRAVRTSPTDALRCE